MAVQKKKAIRAFRVKDLMINIVPQRSGGGGGTYLPGENTLDTIPTPITPVVIGAHLSPRLRFIDNLLEKPDQLDLEVLDRVALEVGRAVVAPMFNAAQCVPDAPTCQAYPRISPFASLDRGLRLDDLVMVGELIDQASVVIDKIEDSRLAEARKLSGELVPRFEEALRELGAR